MIGAAQRYKELMSELLLLRELTARGELEPREEARFAAALDRCWHAMTDDEQAEIEQLLAEQRPPASMEEPNAIDQRVIKGEHTAPRRAA